MVATKQQSSGSSRTIPILVALIGAAGVVIAAWIAGGGDSPDDNGDSITADEVSEAPDIAGRYLLDPDNPRVIIVRSVGPEAYTVEEKMPANWPFEGTVEWTDEGTYRGMATFAAGTEMWVTLVPNADGSLRATFDYIRDNDGMPMDRVDEHLFVPE